MFDIVVTYSGNLLSGQVGPRHLSPVSVWSGHVGSGSVGGANGTRSIASGTVGPNDLGSGSVLSGAIASGQIGRFHVASGQFAGFELGSGSIVSGRVASGQIGHGHYADASVQSGDIASGIVFAYHLQSGTIFPGPGIDVTIAASGITVTNLSGAGGGAPTNAEYIVGAANGSLSAERVVTDTTGNTGVTWDLATAAQAKANATNAGKWIKLSTATATDDATVDFTLPAGYVAYKLEFAHVAPASDGVNGWFRTSTDGGSTFSAGASDYKWALFAVTSAASSAAAGDGADSEIEITGTSCGNAANETLSGQVIIFNPSAAQFGTITFHTIHDNTTGVLFSVFGAGQRVSAADVDAIRFMFSSGNVTSGQFDLFGMAA